MTSLPRTCPYCGADLTSDGAIHWTEMVEVRRAAVVRGSRILVDGDSERIISEVCQDEAIRCSGCGEAVLQVDGEDLVKHVDAPRVEETSR